MANVVLRQDNRRVVCSEFPWGVERVRRCVATMGERVQHHKRFGSREPRRYELSWQNATEGQARLVRLAFQAAGSTKAMNYLPEDDDDGGLVEVVFAEDTLEITRASVSRWTMRFDVVEVIR